MGTNNSDLFPIATLQRLCGLIQITPTDLLSVSSTAGRYYEPFDLKKGIKADGSVRWRHIDNPTSDLKFLQTRIYKRILEPYAHSMPVYLTGGMPGRSIIDNASFHLSQPAIVTLDIEDCFPSIGHRKIYYVWRNQLRCSPDVASVLTRLTTFRYRLPQGSPVSPVLCNLALQPLADDISSYAKKQKLNFSLYMDDITLSGSAQLARNAIDFVIRRVNGYGYKINSEKICVMDSNESQKVTGISANQKPSIQRKKIEELRLEILELGKVANEASSHELNSIWGKINHVKNVNLKKGLKLENLARSKIGDTIGIPKTRPKDITRTCRNINRKH